MRWLKRIVHAPVSGKLFSVKSFHVTKLHIYLAIAGFLCISDFHHGEHSYGLGVLALAFIDMLDE